MTSLNSTEPPLEEVVLPSLVDACAERGQPFVYVDFDTLERKPKLSAEWFREAARQNAVV